MNQKQCGLVFRCIGQYLNKKKRYNEMIICYKISSHFKNSDSMNSLGYYYGTRAKQKNTKKMLKYYNNAVKYKNATSMKHLGFYYKGIDDHCNALRYFKMACDNGYRNMAFYAKRLNEILKNKFNIIIAHKNKQYLCEMNFKKYAEGLELHYELTNKEKSECMVCYENKHLIELNCHNTHKLCCGCLTNISRCPLCRKKI